MKFWHFCRTLTLGLTLLLLTAGCGQPAITFVHMTDPQIGFRDTTAGFRQSDTLMQRAVAAANALRPDAVFITGDLVNDPDDSLQFLHCPIVRETLDEPEDYFNFSPEKRARYLALLKQYGVEAVFAGHTHCGYTATVDGIAFYTASAIGNCLKHGEPGINVVRVSRKGIEVTFVPTSDKEQ